MTEAMETACACSAGVFTSTAKASNRQLTVTTFPELLAAIAPPKPQSCHPWQELALKAFTETVACDYTSQRKDSNPLFFTFLTSSPAPWAGEWSESHGYWAGLSNR